MHQVIDIQTWVLVVDIKIAYEPAPGHVGHVWDVLELRPPNSVRLFL